MIVWNKGEFYPTVIKEKNTSVSTIGIVVIMLLLLACIATLVYGSEDRPQRRSIVVLENGEHIPVPYPGECNEFGCVMIEKNVPQWNGVLWLHQFVDTDGDDICDVYRIWKPLEDPTYGIFYTIYKDKPCDGAI